ncbi:CPBP family intramembrane glutamic endopeptidase [Roseivivax isoporae]|uniref:CAAX prenyl protease 2/Lysostaphin resistance protein A-like domain-containing protein n=1 Tax=Roseivivax isoporae LMG 25204 TaxID=1449351 RepID=X7F2M2_9RHOB|nr:type II CAAX endopeptidase family protein [Roseivivax isoporae]ETX26978.1 hypothetical protein RISW2_17330 [Roseivivax isoporae LMG 25204]
MTPVNHVSRSLEPPSLSAIGIGISVYYLLLSWTTLVAGDTGSDRLVLHGIIGSFGGGVAGLGGFAAVYFLRSRSLFALGVRPVRAQWIIPAIALGIAGYGVSLIVQHVSGVSGQLVDDPQPTLRASVQAGLMPFVLSFIGGAILTPIGEEFLFRGVVANALNRYGAWAGVGLSALIFGIVHGSGMTLLLAITIGLLSGMLFRTTGSVWPSVGLHATYNGMHSMAYAFS